jgi:protein-S-isoprenylcysteine O-methyltransferase Ste14
LKHPSRLAAAVAAAGSVFSVATGIVEERESIAKFGAEYQSYRSKTKMFVPFIL